MIITDAWPSLHENGQWYWYAGDTVTGWHACGYAADEWLAKAYARVATKRHQKEQDTTP